MSPDCYGYLSLFIFSCTPVHFWALAILIKEDYARAGVPMLPVVRGERATVSQIWCYAVLTVAISAVPLLLPGPKDQQAFGLVYLCSAVLLGGFAILVQAATAVALLGALLLGLAVPLEAALAAALVPSALLLVAATLASIDLFLLLPAKRRLAQVRVDPPASARLTVALTAYEDEASIGLAVADFLGHPAVARVVVVDNASRDATAQLARAAGAVVVVEPVRGYGACVHRALREASAYEDTELVVLCEGDRTFRAFDLDKLLAYAAHADVVNGTRIVEQLRSPRTQLTTFMYYGNFFVGKLLEVKHLGAGTFTDIGTTYKLCRRQALVAFLPRLNPAIDLEFNAHFLDLALASGLGVVECPITFFRRVGASKGGNTDNWRALRVGLRMIRGLLLGWPARTTA